MTFLQEGIPTDYCVFVFVVELPQSGVDGRHVYEGESVGCGMVDGNGRVLRLHAVDVGNRQLFLCTLHHRLVVGNLLPVATPAASLIEDVRLFQQADGVLLAVGGGEGEEVGGLRA